MTKPKSKYDKVVGRLLRRENVKASDLIAAWRTCPTEYPHPALRDYTAAWLQLRIKRAKPKQ